MNVKPEDLNKLMEFDHPIRVHADGTVSEPKGFYAPNLMDDEIDSSQWSFFTDGYSGQSGYSGPIMHNSEFIGGSLARDVLATPGIYVAIVANWSSDDDDSSDTEDTSEGWAIVRLDDEYDPDHIHQWGTVEHSRMAGTPHRSCLVPFCSTVSLDLSDTDDT